MRRSPEGFRRMLVAINFYLNLRCLFDRARPRWTSLGQALARAWRYELAKRCFAFSLSASFHPKSPARFAGSLPTQS